MDNETLGAITALVTAILGFVGMLMRKNKNKKNKDE